jgi:hypothetical protein
MPDTTDRSKLEALKENLEGIANASSQVGPAVSHAIRDFVAAISYEDKTLMKSSWNSLLEAFCDFVRDIIQKEIAASHATKTALQEGWRHFVDGVACEDFDELTKEIGSFIDKRIASMTRVRDEAVRVLERSDRAVENASQLEDCIRDLEKVKENILKDWPLTSKPLPPVNRQMIAEARAAIARGETGMRREDLIWGSDPSKKHG